MEIKIRKENRSVEVPLENSVRWILDFLNK